jgi:hypothetical protein
MGKRIANQTRATVLAEAHARSREAWAQLKAQVAEAEAKGSPLNQQLVSMTGNEIRRQYDRDLDAAYELPEE